MRSMEPSLSSRTARPIRTCRRFPASSPRRRISSATPPRTASARCVSMSAVSMRSIRTSCLNGIRFNDAMTGYGPWSLWSGLNDATRNQENTSGLEMMDYGIGRYRRHDEHQRACLADAQGLPRERFECQPDLPVPCDGLLRFGTAGQRLVVCLLVRYAPGRQRLCGRYLLQRLLLFRFGREALRQQPPPGSDDHGFAFGARCAAGLDRRGLRPLRQQLLQPQCGLSGRQAAQLACARHARADRHADLHLGHVGAHAPECRHVAAFRQERLLGADVERRSGSSRRLLPLSALVRLRTVYSGRNVRADLLFRHAEVS